MYLNTEIAKDIYYVGVNDRIKHKFENMLPLPYGVSYNSYLIVDEKVALVDTVEISFGDVFIDKIQSQLRDRQTGVSTYNLIKEYKSGWKAFWANSTARLFSINLKTEYRPYEVKEDYHIEGILTAAFDLRQLTKQEAAKPIDYDKLNIFWINKAKAATKEESK